MKKRASQIAVAGGRGGGHEDAWSLKVEKSCFGQGRIAENSGGG
ncbi:unnamed protein product [Nezara viridula]|uniref:Uncharacterized protein n=1 Tax=Nezara viridula TaxID=85310 RepID=A0A9P0E7W1_NEZVI|nr:unnamed protein product [Nezara viridula]